jgi:hypothetical protein
MIYQHAIRDRGYAIAKALGAFVRDARSGLEKPSNDVDTGLLLHLAHNGRAGSVPRPGPSSSVPRPAAAAC